MAVDVLDKSHHGWSQLAAAPGFARYLGLLEL